MRIRISLARELTLAAVSGVESYYEAAETGLKEVADRELERIRDAAGAEQWEYEDWGVATRECANWLQTESGSLSVAMIGLHRMTCCLCTLRTTGS